MAAGGGRGSSGEAGPIAEGLGLDNAPPGASFGAAWAAMESSTLGGMGRFRIAGGRRRWLAGWLPLLAGAGRMCTCCPLCRLAMFS